MTLGYLKSPFPSAAGALGLAKALIQHSLEKGAEQITLRFHLNVVFGEEKPRRVVVPAFC